MATAILVGLLGVAAALDHRQPTTDWEKANSRTYAKFFVYALAVALVSDFARLFS